jgi:hypothetical protein
MWNPLRKIRLPRWLPRRRERWTPHWVAQTPGSDGAAALALSVVVICYKMDGQIGNTLRSLSVPYQREIAESDYEVIVVDNGSPEPLHAETWKLAENIRYLYVPPADAASNPGVALNRAIRTARGCIVCVMIDGARMVTPGVLHWGLRMAMTAPRALVEVRGWHLGFKVQTKSVLEGYSSDVERELLRGIEWPTNGYRLFEIGTPAYSSGRGFYGKATETTCAFMSRALYTAIGGYDERYADPGGGMGNVDFFWRATAAADVVYTLLGEGTFHQVHSGAATGLTPEQLKVASRAWRQEYERLSRKWDSQPPPYDPILAGHVPQECQRWLVNEKPTSAMVSAS